MRVLRLVLAVLVAAAIPLLVATPAHAVLVGTCEASGTLKSTGVTYDPTKVDDVTLPLTGDVAWKGSVKSPSRGPRAISGSVRAKLPWPLPKVKIGSWKKPSDSYADNNVYHYDFPSVLGGAEIPLTGIHTEKGVVCAGAVIVHLEGGGFSNPAVIGSFVVLVISGFGLFVAFRPKVV